MNTTNPLLIILIGALIALLWLVFSPFIKAIIRGFTTHESEPNKTCTQCKGTGVIKIGRYHMHTQCPCTMDYNEI